MATALSHELRNTFAEINGGIYTLRQKLAGSDPGILNTIETLRVSLDYATTILSNALTFSYRKKPILSTIDVNYLIDDLLAMPNMKELFRNHAVKIDKRVSGAIPSITADALQLRELFTNIITNGVQAMESGGKLSFFVDNNRGSIRVKITDTGPGMPEETVKNLFTPFFTTKSRGLGLGLCIAKMIVQEHGGLIEVNSTPGKGTTFIISIPVARKAVIG
jgi:two-component system, NtrC family, sensor kinase